MPTLFPISNYEEDIPGYGMGNPMWQPPVPPQAQAQPQGRRRMNPLALAGMGLLGGLWSQHNPQGFDASVAGMRQGLLERERQRIADEQNREEAEWRKTQDERWRQDRDWQLRKWESEQKYQLERDKLEDARKATEFKTTQENVGADNKRADRAEARQTSQFNSENYGYPWGPAEKAQGMGAAGLNAGLGAVGAATGFPTGLMAQVQPGQIDVGRPAQSYINKQETGEGRGLQNYFLQNTMQPRIDAVSLRNEGMKLQQALQQIELETRPQMRQLQIQQLQQVIGREPLTRMALQALISGRQIDNKWAGLLNLDRVLENSGLSIDPSGLLQFDGNGRIAPSPTGGITLIPTPADANTATTAGERTAAQTAELAKLSGMEPALFEAWHKLGFAPGPQMAKSIAYWWQPGRLLDKDGKQTTDGNMIAAFIADQQKYSQPPKPPVVKAPAKPATKPAAKGTGLPPVPKGLEAKVRKAYQKAGGDWNVVSRLLTQDGATPEQRLALRKRITGK